MTPESIFEMVIGNVLAAVMLWLYTKQQKDIKEERDDHKKAISEKDLEIKALNDSINQKVIQLLDEQRKYLTDNN